MPRKEKEKRVEPDFDFIAPYSMDECIERLTHLQELRDIDFVPRIRIHCDVLNDDTCKFIIQRSGPDTLKIYGYLNRLDGRTTYVSGSSGMSRQTFHETGFLVAAVVLLSPFVGLIVSVGLLGGLGAFVHYYRHGMTKEVYRIQELMKDILFY